MTIDYYDTGKAAPSVDESYAIVLDWPDGLGGELRTFRLRATSPHELYRTLMMRPLTQHIDEDAFDAEGPVLPGMLDDLPVQLKFTGMSDLESFRVVIEVLDVPAGFLGSELRRFVGPRFFTEAYLLNGDVRLETHLICVLSTAPDQDPVRLAVGMLEPLRSTTDING